MKLHKKAVAQGPLVTSRSVNRIELDGETMVGKEG